MTSITATDFQKLSLQRLGEILYQTTSWCFFCFLACHCFHVHLGRLLLRRCYLKVVKICMFYSLCIVSVRFDSYSCFQPGVAPKRFDQPALFNPLSIIKAQMTLSPPRNTFLQLSIFSFSFKPVLLYIVEREHVGSKYIRSVV